MVTTDDGTVKATHVDLGRRRLFIPTTKASCVSRRSRASACLPPRTRPASSFSKVRSKLNRSARQVPEEVRKRYENLERQDLPPLPPNEDLAPRTPGPDESAHLRDVELEQARFAPSGRTGWARSTMLL